VFPVPTGLNRLAFYKNNPQASVPRTHGAEPRRRIYMGVVMKCSPYPRG